MIENYYTESVVVSRKTWTKAGGVVKETLTTAWTGLIAFDKSTSSNSFDSGKETYTLAATVYAPIISGIIEDDILTYDSIAYDVQSSLDPLKRGHHLEIALSKRD